MMSCIGCVEKINDLSFFLSLLIGSRLECPMVYVDYSSCTVVFTKETGFTVTHGQEHF